MCVCGVQDEAAAAVDDSVGAASAVEVHDDRYVGGVKIYGAGLIQDPIVGSKRGKGAQNLNSSVWVEAVGAFIAKNLLALQRLVAHVQALDEESEASAVFTDQVCPAVHSV